jgi:hypothetical protein
MQCSFMMLDVLDRWDMRQLTVDKRDGLLLAVLVLFHVMRAITTMLSVGSNVEKPSQVVRRTGNMEFGATTASILSTGSSTSIAM